MSHIDPAMAGTRGFRQRLRDIRIRSKLGLILIVPLTATVVFAALRLVDTADRLAEADSARALASVAVEAATVAHQLHQERSAAIEALADPQASGDGFDAQAVATDTAIDTYQETRSRLGEVPEPVAVRLTVVDEQLVALGTLREAVRGDRPIAASAVVLRYGTVLSDLLAYTEAVAAVVTDPELAEAARAVAAWAKAKTHAADAAAIAQLTAAAGRISPEQLSTFLATQTGQQAAFLTFQQTANPFQQTVADQAITGGSLDYRAVSVAPTEVAGAELAAASASLAGTVDAARWAERQLHAQLVASADQLRDDVAGQVMTESAAVVAALALALLLAVLLARQLATSLGRLRTHALKVADRDLPETVRRLSDPHTLGEHTPAQLAAQVHQPAALQSRDEIGQVAQSFGVVQRVAVRIAAEQAALRTSVAAMFLTLARRSQSLVDRMISQLDDIERTEEDPQRLAKLFTLDHLATRMRRNDENLLILAGADSSPPRTSDALLIDVVRAAQSEVEHYNRIEFGAVDTDVSVVAEAVNDVVRLVAELFDNATRFSAPHAPVVCEARRLRDQVIVQVDDRGVGMAPEQVDRVNTWLATPPEVEVATFRKMGLAVVSRLAARHHMRVELRSDPGHGTVAYVVLPAPILILPTPIRRTNPPVTGRAIHQPAPLPQATPPPPARHLAQRHRSADVAHHAAGRRAHITTTATGGGSDTAAVAGPPYEPIPGDTPMVSLPVAPPAAVPHPRDTVELPIFKEMEAVWFRNHPGDGPDTALPLAGGYPAADPPGWARPATNPPPAPAPAVRPAPPITGIEPHPGVGDDGATDRWHTAADEGWQRAAAATTPHPAGTTGSGLPKRMPQAQLVPGSVPTATTTRPPQQRRTPEEVRGLLAAYQRGVQRGRHTIAGR